MPALTVQSKGFMSTRARGQAAGDSSNDTFSGPVTYNK